MRDAGGRDKAMSLYAVLHGEEIKNSELSRPGCVATRDGHRAGSLQGHKKLPRWRAIWPHQPITPCGHSVPANIAEGHARTTTKDYLRFVSVAIGSFAETATFIELAGRLNYGNVDELRRIFEMTTEERRMLRDLQKSLRRRLPPP
jgi:four helix bundle protein